MKKYIDADALIKKIFPYDVVDPKCYSINAKAVYEEIKRSPSADVVEVVRCKDCKHYKTPECAMWLECCTCGGQWDWCNPNDYCSYGERSENGK